MMMKILVQAYRFIRESDRNNVFNILNKCFKLLYQMQRITIVAIALNLAD